jgi:hypothetical protein
MRQRIVLPLALALGLSLPASGYTNPPVGDPGIQWVMQKSPEQTVVIRTLEQNKKPLEEIVFTDKEPRTIALTEWEMPMLSRLVPVKRLIEKHAHHYGIHPMWATMFFNFESQLNPVDVNTLSDDYGMGQIKRESEVLAKRMGTSPASKYYSPDLRADKSIFDPETNIIMAMMLHRYNIDTLGLKNSDQAYSIYVRGKESINRDGSLGESTRKIVDSLRDRYQGYSRIIPLFRLDDLSRITNPDQKKSLEIYRQTADPRTAYQALLGHFLMDLESVQKPEARTVLVFEDCVTFARTLRIAYAEQNSAQYERLRHVAEKIARVIPQSMTERFGRAAQLLNLEK